MDINQRIGQRVLALRQAQDLSLDALAARCGVSRSHISLIERGRSSPTAAVLDKLASGLGAVLASLFEAPPSAAAAPPSPVVRAADQPVWTDPASGYMRRHLSPPAAVDSPLQLVDVVFPAGQRVAYDNAGRGGDVHQQVWVIDGVMEVSAGTDRWRLAAGDCLSMQLDRPTAFRNPTRQPSRYLVALATVPAVALRSRR